MFNGGRLYLTAGVNNRVADSAGFSKFVLDSIKRHMTGEWGDLGPEDKKTNDLAVEDGGRIFSAYILNGDKIWIITEADRSATTVLFPDEY